jgi:hypothetical protein
MDETLRKMAEHTAEEWRELGFYYDFDERISVNQWRFHGSRAGLANFSTLLRKYVANPRKATLSEHDHYGPYWYLKIVTCSEAVITDRFFGGSLDDLAHLAELIATRLERTKAGETFEISQDYGSDNTVTARFFVMADDFDPVSIDELIVSGRQAVVNANMAGQRKTVMDWFRRSPTRSRS